MSTEAVRQRARDALVDAYNSGVLAEALQRKLLAGAVEAVALEDVEDDGEVSTRHASADEEEMTSPMSSSDSLRLPAGSGLDAVRSARGGRTASGVSRSESADSWSTIEPWGETSSSDSDGLPVTVDGTEVTDRDSSARPPPRILESPPPPPEPFVAWTQGDGGGSASAEDGQEGSTLSSSVRLRVRAYAALLTATQDGRLEAALTTLTDGHAETPAESSQPAYSSSHRDAEAYDDEVVEVEEPQVVQQAERRVDAQLRRYARDTLLLASADGRLSAALESILLAPSGNIEALRQQARDTLAHATFNGQLARALAEVHFSDDRDDDGTTAVAAAWLTAMMRNVQEERHSQVAEEIVNAAQDRARTLQPDSLERIASSCGGLCTICLEPIDFSCASHDEYTCESDVMHEELESGEFNEVRSSSHDSVLAEQFCVLPCHHAFHVLCASGWFRRCRSTCPNCRLPATD
eukprot:TRINITY_DN14643_c0_g1_i2.p1 TRINITY_DN14643_c0_g1~~TRINITY_DN14643_c0_g1_i2.p1  ORF type:complete len:465 (+),score=83.87 TRINITY_DN14643_c0_g1_i2:98-1492(+)